MIAVVDANVILRFLIDDVPSQTDKVERRFRQAKEGKLSLFVYHITIVEVLFQLEHWYKYPKEKAVDRLLFLFSPSWFELEQKEEVALALEMYKILRVDFVDVMLLTLTKKRNAFILSFDKDFDKLSPKLRIEP